MKTKTIKSMLLALALALAVILTITSVFLPPPALATQYAFTTIDVPGAAGTYAQAINNFGDIVGRYYAVQTNGCPGWFGFLYVGGSFTSIIPINCSETAAFGINNSGTIVGYDDNYCKYYAYSDLNGSFTLIDVGVDGTLAYGINNAGDIVGYYTTVPFYVYNGFVGGPTVNDGFLDVGGSLTSINVPDALSTYAYGINDSGQVTGYYNDATGNHGFVYSAGVCTTIDVPSAKGGEKR